MVMRRHSAVLDLGMRPPHTARLLSAFLKIRRRAGKREVFDAARMKRMLRSGQPDDANNYLERFLPVSSSRDWSQLFTRLLAIVGVFKTLANVAAGDEVADRIASLFANPIGQWVDMPAGPRLDKIIALMHSDRDRLRLFPHPPWKTINHRPPDVLLRNFLRIRQAPRKKRSERYSVSPDQHIKVQQLAPKPMSLETDETRQAMT